MAKHLRPGGVLLVEPWIHPQDYAPGHLSVDHVENDEISVIRVGRSLLQGKVLQVVLDHYVSCNGVYTTFTEYLILAPYTIEEYMGAFETAGLEVRHDKKGLMGRGLFIGQKPNEA